MVRLCVCTRTSVESLTRAWRECGSTALLNPGNSLRTTRHGWYPETHAGAKVCLRLPSNTRFWSHIHRVCLTNSFLQFYCLRQFYCLFRHSLTLGSLKADWVNKSFNKNTIVHFQIVPNIASPNNIVFFQFLKMGSSANLQSDNAVQLHSYGCCHCIAFQHIL